MNEHFEGIVDKHYNEIFHYVYKQVNDLEDTKDLTQDIFMKVHGKLHTYKSHISSIRTWLYRIAHNIVVNHFRSSYYRKKVDLDDLVLETLQASNDVIEAAIQAESIEHIIHKMYIVLNKKHFRIMNLYFFSRLSTTEIAEVLNISKKTVNNVINLSIKKIRSKMEV